MNEYVDPTDATALQLSRGAFVGLSVAAAASTNARAMAQTLGTSHQPLVPEDDPSIVVDHLHLRRPDGDIGAYAAWPTHALANAPSIVVIMHIWGVDTLIRDVVRRFAKAGFAAIAPDLYSRFGAPSGDGSSDIDRFRPFAQKLNRKEYDGDIRAAALWVSTKFPQGKTGVMGFCMGGHIVLVQAMDNNDIFAAAAPFYGGLNDIDAEKIHMPICGSYGERDTSIPAEDVRTFRSQLPVPKDIRIYPTAGHAFFDDQRSSYVASAAEDAWRRTVGFFENFLSHPS